MRVTGGRFRSRALKAPRGTTTRPTSDRVREAMFSMLASDGLLAPGARVLDLYAGSGALALEAISRGAAEAVLVEHGRDALAAIRENVRALDVEAEVRVVPSRVDRAVTQLRAAGAERFDVAFVDPPYADVPTAAFAAILAEVAGLLGDQGALVLEHASGDAPPEVPGLAVDRTRRYGDTSVTLFRIPDG